MNNAQKPSGSRLVRYTIICLGLLSLAWYAIPGAMLGAPPPPVVVDPIDPVGDEDDPGGGGGGTNIQPTHSIVFVIDGSDSMYPRVGPNYFELAKEGIANILDGGHLDYSGTLEISVIQFTDLDAAGYIQGRHWIAPQRTYGATRAELKRQILSLERSTHHTATLMEMGIREAVAVHGQLSYAPTEATRHIILLTSGEFRIPLTDVEGYSSEIICPPIDYSVDSLGDASGTIWDSFKSGCNIHDFPNEGDIDCGTLLNPRACNRACAIRYHAKLARNKNISISTMQLGYDWSDTNPPAIACRATEDDNPYGNTINIVDDTIEAVREQGYCNTSITPRVLNSPTVPDRDGLLKEITDLISYNPYTEFTVGPCEGASGSPLTPFSRGFYKRIEPIICFDCEDRIFYGGRIRSFPPGSSRQIADTVKNWLCAWGYSEDLDVDGFLQVCDNCPSIYNPAQRDCNRNGIGDECQDFLCGGNISDQDGDGVCDGLDQCITGDDCLIAYWKELRSCGISELSDDCACDCDNDGNLDLCQAAIEDNLERFDNALPSTFGFSHDEYSVDANLTTPGIPALCNAEKYTDPNDPATLVKTIYEEDFSDATRWPLTLSDNSDTFIDQQDDDITGFRGWWMYPTETDPVTGVENATSKNFARIVEDRFDPDRSQVLELSLDTTQATDGSYTWFIESPGMIIPDHKLDTLVAGCANPDKWGVIAVEMDLFIGNAFGGTEYDLYVLDPCEDDPELAKRVHLRFRTSERTDDTKVDLDRRGSFYFEQYQYGGWRDIDAGMYPMTDLFALGSGSDHFPQSQWFTLKIFLNEADLYPATGGANWAGNGSESVHVYMVDQDGNKKDRGKIRELGPPVPNDSRGVQIRIESNNRECDCSAYPGDSNDYWDPRRMALEVCGTHDCADCINTEAKVKAMDVWLADHCANDLTVSNMDDIQKGDFCESNRSSTSAENCDIPICLDNCPNFKNPWQIDSDRDGWGDACDGYWGAKSAFDGAGGGESLAKDGVWGMFDNCPVDHNPPVRYDSSDSNYDCAETEWGLVDGDLWQPDRDCDGIGDACDTCDGFDYNGVDNAGNPISSSDVCNCTIVECKLAYDPNQYDRDKDVDQYLFGEDSTDVCPYVGGGTATHQEFDWKGNFCSITSSCCTTGDTSCCCPDGRGNYCDSIANTFNPDQADIDRNGISNLQSVVDTFDPVPIPCDPTAIPGAAYACSNPNDIDDDGILNWDAVGKEIIDNCYSIYNPLQNDTDKDGLGDVCDGNTHLTDCNGDGEVDQLGTLCRIGIEPAYLPLCSSVTTAFCNPCYDPTCPNDGKPEVENDSCMCLSPGVVFQLNPPDFIKNETDRVQGGIDGGICPNGPCASVQATATNSERRATGCVNVLRLRNIKIRRTDPCEWKDGEACPVNKTCVATDTLLCNIWSCVDPPAPL